MDIVQHQEFVLAGRVGKEKAAKNVLPRKDVGELTIILIVALLQLIWCR